MGGRKPTAKDIAMIKIAHLYPKAPAGMKHFPLAVVGSNLGGFVTRTFVHHTWGFKEQMIVVPNSVNEVAPLRYSLEESRVPLYAYFMGATFGVEPSAEVMEGTSVSKYLPEENAIELANGTRYTYDQLVIAQGRPTDFEKIPGFMDAYFRDDVPVYCSQQHPEFGVTNNKHLGWLSDFKHGDAYFYIPEFPFKGEIGAYNFLAAADLWRDRKKLGVISPNAKLTVINANDRFCQFEPETEEVIRNLCEQYEIEVKFNTTLEGVDADNQRITIGGAEQAELDFNALYVIPPSKPNQELIDAGLTDPNSKHLMDVDFTTLQARNYDNIYGVGDVHNAPVTSSYFGGLYQGHLVGMNTYRALKNKPLNAPYDGYTKSLLYTGRSNLTHSIYDYNGPRQGNLLDSNNGAISYMRYLHFGKAKKKFFQSVAMGKATSLRGKNFERKHGGLGSKLVAKESCERSNTRKETPAYTATTL